MVQNKKILIFSHEFPPDIGGVGVVAEQYAKELSNLKYEIDVLTSCKKNKQSFNEFNVTYNKTCGKFWFIGYRNIVDFNQYDVIFLNDPSAIYAAGLFFTKEQLKKSICFLHGSEPERVYESPTLFRKLSFFKYFFNKALFDSKKIISPSYYMKEKFLTSSKQIELSNKINVVYYGVDCSLFLNKEYSITRQSLGIREDQEVLISVSRITKQKGYFNKYNIFKRLINEYKKDLAWIIVGDGEYLKEFKYIVKKDKLEDKIIFLGKVERTKLVEYYNISDVFWLLSEYKESFGLVYIEAQLCGLPVIGNNIGGVKEAIEDGKTGYLINSSNEVIKIIKDMKYKNLDIKTITDYAKVLCIENTLNGILQYVK